MTDIWLVRAIAWYPRKTYQSNNENKSPKVDRPKRPKPTIPLKWCDNENRPCRNLTIPVAAETKEEAKSKVRKKDCVEKLRDKPVTKRS
jgi:hypothetical protein